LIFRNSSTVSAEKAPAKDRHQKTALFVWWSFLVVPLAIVVYPGSDVICRDRLRTDVRTTMENDQFAETGSGQTQGKSAKPRVVFSHREVPRTAAGAAVGH
jgi:hypothetical protein